MSVMEDTGDDVDVRVSVSVSVRRENTSEIPCYFCM